MIMVPGLIVILAVMVLSYGYIKRLPAIYDKIYKDNPIAEETNETREDNNKVVDEALPHSIEVLKTITKATMKIERHYSSCNHILAEEYPMESRYVGKTKEELASMFPDWHLKIFSPEQVVFRVDINSYCPDHYIIKSEDEYLVIFRSDKDTGIPLAVEAMEYDFDRLTTEIQEKVSEGIVVDSIEEVEQLLENWGS